MKHLVPQALEKRRFRFLGERVRSDARVHFGNARGGETGRACLELGQAGGGGLGVPHLGGGGRGGRDRGRGGLGLVAAGRDGQQLGALRVRFCARWENQWGRVKRIC